MSTWAQRVTGLVMVGFAFAWASCAHGTSAGKDNVVKPAEHEEMLEQYRKGVEESKKVPVARVNGAEITMFDLLNRMNRIAPQYMKPGQPRDPGTDARVKQEALDVLIFRELAVQEAVRQGMKVEPEALDRSVKTLKDRLGSEDAYKAYLSREGLTEESLRKGIERDQLYERVAEKEIFQKVQATGKNDLQAVEARRREWEAEMKKTATIEILVKVTN